jgi:hypothetical protein
MPADLSSPSAITVEMLDQSGNAIDRTQFYLTVEDTTIMNISAYTVANGRWGTTLQASGVGRTRLIVDATVYGVSKSDTIEIGVGYPIFVENKLLAVGDTSISGSEFTISHGGAVAFLNGADKPIDILFDDSAAVEDVTADQLTAIVGQASYICLFWFVCPETGNAGNIHALQPAGNQILYFTPYVTAAEFRRFPNPGDYPFHIRPFNTSRIIHVE